MNKLMNKLKIKPWFLALLLP